MGGVEIDIEYITLIFSNWEKLKQRHSLPDFGLKLFDNFFKMEPVLAKKFSILSEGSDGSQLREHAQRVVQTLDGIISSLADLEDVDHHLSVLGQQHSILGIEPENYEFMILALLKTLEGFQAEPFNHILKNAWELVL